MKYAEVAVNSPIARHRSFCYSIPSQLNVNIGQAVWVPFGSKVLQGIVVELSNSPSVEETKEIKSLISSRPLLSSVQVALALWISKYYLASLFDSLALMLPPGFEQRLVTFLQLTPHSVDSAQLDLEQRQVLGIFGNRDKVDLRELRRRFGKRPEPPWRRHLPRAPRPTLRPTPRPLPRNREGSGNPDPRVHP